MPGRSGKKLGRDSLPAHFRPFEPGNALALTHGGMSTLRIQGRASEIADELRQVVPLAATPDEPTIRLLALVLARIEAASDWLLDRGLFRGDAGELQPVLKALSTWENTAARLLERLGCTPKARVELGLDIAAAGPTLERYLEQRRGAQEETP